MNKLQNIFGRIRQWYRHLLVELPDGYGDPISPEVEHFVTEMNEKKELDVTIPNDGKPHPHPEKHS